MKSRVFAVVSTVAFRKKKKPSIKSSMTQQTPDDLLNALKSILHDRKLSYSVIARALDVSLPTVKRMLNKPTIPLSRLLEICDLAEIPLAEVIAAAEELRPRHTIYTPKQDELFFRHPFIRAYFDELLEEKTTADIAKQHKLNRASTDLYLSQLEKVGLIQLDSRGRAELLVSPPLGFGPGSKCLREAQSEFMQSIVSMVVAGDSPLEEKKKRFAIMKPLTLSAKLYRQMLDELLSVVDRYSFLSESPAAESARGSKKPESWQLAIAAGSGEDRQPDPRAKIRNITKASLRAKPR